MRLGLTLACVVAASSAMTATAGGQEGARPARPIGAQGPLGNERLSDELRLTRYARAYLRETVRSRPTMAGRTVGRLRYLTEDGPAEIYPVLASTIDAGGRTWLRIRLPMRPNGQTGWVRRVGLGPLYAVRTMLRVNRVTLRATLYKDGKSIWSSRIGVGAPSTPTPAGKFWIRTRLRGLANNPIYGPYAFGTAAYSVLSDWPGGGVVGIHGTNQPSLIPGRPSHGCIRVPNRAISRLWRLMPVGTPVAIL